MIASSRGLPVWAANLVGSKRLRVAAVVCVALLIYLSWVPGPYEVRTNLPGRIEHSVAYAGAAISFALAYPLSRPGIIAAAFVSLAGVLEAGQIYIPGRHAAVLDWLSSSIGAASGAWLGTHVRAFLAPLKR